ncbi:MAG: HsdM family class I SAM-dependent methyltransferase [Trebonia sp.]
MNEWGFGGEIKSWWDAEFRSHRRDWQITRCELENQTVGDRKRSDLTVIRGGVPLLCGELRLPDHDIPWPTHPDNLSDAVGKALTRGARWAFTSDGVEFLLIDCNKSGHPAARVVHRVSLYPFTSRNALDNPDTLANVESAWREALDELVPILLDRVAPPALNPDELFVDSVRALLTRPVAAIRTGLFNEAGRNQRFHDDLVRWIVDDQAWPHSPDTLGDEIARAAQLTAYVFAVRLMFYEALRRSEPTLNQINVASDDPPVAARVMQVFLADARDKSRDYATIFIWDKVSEFAFISSEAIGSWRRVLDYLGQVQLNALSYDVLGRLFERLIDPDERYHWGQHYTSPSVVDLMLSFALPTGRGSVLDPACGGGTFLVRAYTRMKTRDPGKTHQELLAQIFGIDVSAFAATIATVNLASRSLTFNDNYPRLIARSFFTLDPSATLPLLRIPAPHSVTGDESAGELIPVSLETVSAIVCNPPYVRIKELGADRKAEAQSALLRPLRKWGTPQTVTGSANYHLHFWFHAAQFLEVGGRLAFITASEWMDGDYGAQLQRWLLGNFKILVAIRTLAETWFEDARVGTVVLVAEQCGSTEERDENQVRFVTLRRPLEDLYNRVSHPDGERLQIVDQLRDRIMGLSGIAGEGDDFDWSIIRQSSLRSLGMR